MASLAGRRAGTARPTWTVDAECSQHLVCTCETLVPLPEMKWFWKGCKPSFVCALASGENHLSQQPVPGTRSLSRTRSGQLQGPLFGLAPDGVYRASSLTLRAVVSYTTFSPLPLAGRYPFCCTFPILHRLASTRTVGVTHHRVLWSPDFPLPSLPSVGKQAVRPAATVQPAFQTSS